MNRQILFSVITALTISGSLFGKKNYLGYHDLINQAEVQFVVNRDKAKCYKLYDRAFAEYEKPFVKDFFIASQIAFLNGDTARFLDYVRKCFDSGMPFQCLHAAHLFDPLFTNKDLMAKLNLLYITRRHVAVDTLARDSVYMRFYKMESAKKKMGRDSLLISQYWSMEKSNTAYYASFLTKGTFPSEQLIGLYSEDGFDAFLTKFSLSSFENRPKNLPANSQMAFTRIPDDYALWNEAAFVSFLHYPCAFINYKSEFWKAVETGYVHPKDYAMLQEWYAKSVSNAWYRRDCMEEIHPSYFNVINELMVTDEKSLQEDELRRTTMHLQKYSVDLLKKKLQTEKGFVFFFGFFDYR